MTRECHAGCYSTIILFVGQIKKNETTRSSMKMQFVLNDRDCKEDRFKQVASTVVGRRLPLYTTKPDETANLLNLINPPF